MAFKASMTLLEHPAMTNGVCKTEFQVWSGNWDDTPLQGYGPDSPTFEGRTPAEAARKLRDWHEESGVDVPDDLNTFITNHQ